MGRPRKTDTHLPPCVYFRHGSYFLVRKGVWQNLGSDEATAIRRAAKAPKAGLMAAGPLEEYLLKRMASFRAGAKQRGIPFELTKEDVQHLLKQTGLTCSVTGTPFSLDKTGTRTPYAPSIDRRDCTQGYTRENCRVVCVAANIGMNNWGDGVLAKMAANMAMKMARQLESQLAEQANPSIHADLQAGNVIRQ